MHWMTNLEKEFDVLTAVIKKYGKPAQLRKATEEAAEFIVAIQHLDDPHRPRPDAETRLIKEVSDIEIMLSQMRLMFPGMNAAVAKQRRITIERLHAKVIKQEK